MTRICRVASATSTFTLAILLICSCPAYAFLPGTVLVNPGDTVFPGNATGAAPGTLLASITGPFSTSLGSTSGTYVSAVFSEGGGTLDFYYQLVSSSNSIDGIARATDTNFAGFLTQVGFRTDGGSLLGGLFTNGTVPPVTADRGFGGDVVGFNFQPPVSAEILPGQTSLVFVISTNATNFTSGNLSIIDGGVVTVSAFAPAVPEPESIGLLAIGLLVLGAVHPRIHRRRSS
jgi:hypothetical protein